MISEPSGVSRKQVYEFISANSLATLATVDEHDQPHAATVQFVIHKNFSLYFTTRVEARKYQNLVNKPTVAMVITDGNDMTTVQLTGKAERIEDLKTEQELLLELWQLRFNQSTWPGPAAQMFEKGATNQIAVIKVTPSELSYAVFNPQPTGKYKPFFHKII